MNIALIGYGKMGRAIGEIAMERGHRIALKIDLDNQDELDAQHLAACDVAIEFTGPESAFRNVMTCIQHRIPVVCGSTGWLQHLAEAKEACIANGSALLYASNFSVGVNIFFAINKLLAELMAAQDSYDVRIHEIHHTQKKDAPSGTAITLAEQILERMSRKKKWVEDADGLLEDLLITSERVDPASGTHVVTYTSTIDDIEIKHTAHNRQGFATGAVLAAEFLAGKKGIFGMNDVLGL